MRARLTLARQATLDAITDGVLSIDAERVIQSANEVACRVLAISVPSPLGEVGRLSFLEPLLSRSEGGDAGVFRIGDQEHMVQVRAIRVAGRAAGHIVTLTAMKHVQRIAQGIAGPVARFSFGDIVGEAPVLRACLERARAAARSDASVLITGESGTGKELLAQAIHNGGPRATDPFVGVNCAAIPRELLESELFGYEEGAFTGARRGGQPRRFSLADGGTLLLDEIGEMPLEMQVKVRGPAACPHRQGFAARQQGA